MEAVTQESTSRDNGTNRERPKKAFSFVTEREGEKADKKRRGKYPEKVPQYWEKIAQWLSRRAPRPLTQEQCAKEEEG